MSETVRDRAMLVMERLNRKPWWIDRHRFRRPWKAGHDGHFFRLISLVFFSSKEQVSSLPVCVSRCASVVGGLSLPVGSWHWSVCIAVDISQSILETVLEEIFSVGCWTVSNCLLSEQFPDFTTRSVIGGGSVQVLDEIEMRWQTVPSQTQQIIY